VLFPVTIATVQGLRSPQKMEMELVHTYAARRVDIFWMVRLPSSLPYLFPAFRVAIASGLVGTMVAELPTGAQAGLGQGCSPAPITATPFRSGLRW
jgi:NitT/TauT family transport system permease protein